MILGAEGFLITPPRRGQAPKPAAVNLSGRPHEVTHCHQTAT